MKLMSAKRFIDTNILIYAFSQDASRSETAEAVLWEGGSISVQVLDEFAHVCRRKLNLDWAEIERRLLAVKRLVREIAPISIGMHERAVELAHANNFSFYDALIVAAALSLKCTQLLTEDMQHGRSLGGVLIVNPFLPRQLL